MTSYDTAVARLYELGHELARTSGHKFDLELVRVLLAALDHPERRFASVLIGGTNGKGSTAATLASILRAAGHRTALYTSPHLLRINERIRVNGEEIRDEDFALAFARVEAVAQQLVSGGQLPWHPSFFEMLTAMAFTHFAEPPVDIAVLEVGMGGRLDATNVVDPLVSVITDISLDHEKFLGHTIREIAREKAGIIRPGGTVVTLPQHPEANDVIGNTVLERGATAINAAPFVPPVAPGSEPSSSRVQADDPQTGAASLQSKPVNSKAPMASGHRAIECCSSAHTCYSLEVMGEEIQVDSPLVGRHQWRNLALAIAAAEQLNRLGVQISPKDIMAGIRRTCWPGRFQVLAADRERGLPEIVLDVAHNPAGAWALRAALSTRYGQAADHEDRPDPVSEGSLIFVFGAMRDKAIAEMAAILFPLAQHVIATRADTPRSAAPEEIRALAGRIFMNIDCEATVASAVERACSLAAKNAVVVVTGSIYIVGEAMAALQARNALQP